MEEHLQSWLKEPKYLETSAIS